MGTGRRVGLRLGEWLAAGTAGLDNGLALGNRLCDLLGADQALAGPLRDLARRPQLQRALQSEGMARRSALRALVADLQSTYAPLVLAELIDLLEAALAETGLREPGTAEGALIAPAPPEHPAPGIAAAPIGSPPRRRHDRSAMAARLRALARQLRPLGPGLALGAAMALVLSWLAGVLERLLFRPWNWSGGVALVMTLTLVQLLTTGPLNRLRRGAGLAQEASGEAHGAWRWVTAAWIHDRNAEALLHALVLLLILGPSPLALEDEVLRYALTALACMALACLSAGRRGLGGQRWAGASGVSGSLIGLAVGLSLLRWREISFPLGTQTVPAWVLLVVVGSGQLVWILPRGSGGAASGTALDRLLSSQWFWGLVLGLTWAFLTWGASLLPSGAPAGR